MSEHKSPEQKSAAYARDLMKTTEIDMDFAKSISNQFKCNINEALARVNNMKRFALLYGNALDKSRLATVIDIMAAGVIVPTNGSELDFPLSSFIARFEVEATANEANGHKNCRLDINADYLGKKYCVSILRKKEADAIKAKCGEPKATESADESPTA